MIKKYKYALPVIYLFYLVFSLFITFSDKCSSSSLISFCIPDGFALAGIISFPGYILFWLFPNILTLLFLIPFTLYFYYMLGKWIDDKKSHRKNKN